MIFYSYMSIREKEQCVCQGLNHPLSKGCGWILARNEHISFHTESFMQVVHIRISEEAVTEYLLRATSPAMTDAENEVKMKI